MVTTNFHRADLHRPYKAFLGWLLLCCALLALTGIAQAATPLEDAIAGLNAKNFKAKERAVQALAAHSDVRIEAVLQAMLEGDLYYRKSDRRVVIAAASDAGYRVRDALSNEDLGEVGKRKIKKISVNNRLRTVLRGAITRLQLYSPDTATRLQAAGNMLGALDSDSIELLRKRVQQEQDGAVLEALHTALALGDLRSDDQATRLASIAAVKGNLANEVRNQLQALLKQRDDGTFVEQDPSIRAAARDAITSIELKLQLNELTETLFFGLSLGSVLLLAAIGLAITFGVMGVINMAHGELIMIGAYTTYLVQLAMPNYLDYSLFVAIPAAFLVSGLFGIAIERGVIRFLYGRPLETLLATFGISLVLQQLVRTTISAQNVAVSNPSWMSGSLQVNAALSLTFNRIYILIFALLAFAALVAILKKTPLGLQVRAVSQNRPMAKAMGIRSEWVDAMTFGLGSGVAGVAGVALSQLTNVGPNMGQSYIIDSFMVVVFGGVANLWGTLVGAMTLGVANKFLEPYSGAVLAKILVLVFIILFIQKRPRGLFPQKGRAAEN